MINKPNRSHKSKVKKGSGCKMCKPHKGGWGPRMKAKERPVDEVDGPSDYEQASEAYPEVFGDLCSVPYVNTKPRSRNRYRIRVQYSYGGLRTHKTYGDIEAARDAFDKFVIREKYFKVAYIEDVVDKKIVKEIRHE